MSEVQQRPRLLLLDDEPALLWAIQEIVASLGFEAKGFEQGEAAWHAGINEGFDGALLDINLPDLGGVEVAKRWRQAGRNLPLLFVSADANEGERQEAEALSGREVLKKPFRAATLRAILNEIFGQRFDARV